MRPLLQTRECATVHKGPSLLEPRDCGSELGLGPKLWQIVNRQPYEHQPRFQGPVHHAAIAGPVRQPAYTHEKAYCVCTPALL
jgi:hypothetical protein